MSDNIFIFNGFNTSYVTERPSDPLSPCLKYVWLVLVHDMGFLCMTRLQLEELHRRFIAQRQQFIWMKESLNPAPHQWQIAAQQPRPLSWPDKLTYGRDASGPEISLKPAETVMLKKAQKGMLKWLFKDQKSKQWKWICNFIILVPHWLFCFQAALPQTERCSDWLLAADRR